MKKDVYAWAVLYHDGSSIQEYDRPDGHGFAVVDSAQVRRLTLTSPDCSHSVVVPTGAMPVFFRRRSIALQPGGDPIPTVHCIGWKREDKAVYLFISEDGSTLATENLQAV
jgi:hypothetical protein